VYTFKNVANGKSLMVVVRQQWKLKTLMFRQWWWSPS